MAQSHTKTMHDYTRLSSRPLNHNTRASRHGSNTHSGKPNYWKNIYLFTRQALLMQMALLAGTAGATACFAYTYWLSRQQFYCPSWTVHCAVSRPVQWFTDRLGLVQGVLSTIYGICIAMIAYAAYQAAETTLWPALTQKALTLENIDSYLAHVRGSLPSFPSAAWHARKPKHLAVVVIVGLVSLLLQATSTIVGYAFTVKPISTVLQSNHTFGGGLGMAYSQFNPPGPMPAEASQALALYTAWSTGQIEEVLPQLREHLIDRTNFSQIGDFSVPAIYARKDIHCYGHSLNITAHPAGPDYTLYVVGVANIGEFGGSLLLPNGNVLLRFLPNTLTAWVDTYFNTSETRAVTKIVFAILNGTIENGIHGQYKNISKICSTAFDNPCDLGISALACEIDIDIVDSTACNGNCSDNIMHSNLANSKPLTSVNMTTVGTTIGQLTWPLAVWLGAIPTMMGLNIWGAQPMFSTSTPLPNSSYALPQAYSDILGVEGTQEWTVANLTNFINVSSGALSIYAAQSMGIGWTLVNSTLNMPRLSPTRTYALMIPPGAALLSVVIVLILSALMHRNAKLDGVCKGSLSEVLVRSGTRELVSIVEAIRRGDVEAVELEEKELWFGMTSDGHRGLGTRSNVNFF